MSVVISTSSHPGAGPAEQLPGQLHRRGPPGGAEVERHRHQRVDRVGQHRGVRLAAVAHPQPGPDDAAPRRAPHREAGGRGVDPRVHPVEHGDRPRHGRGLAARRQALVRAGNLRRRRGAVHRLGPVERAERGRQAHPLVRPAVVTRLEHPDLRRRHGATHPQHLDAHLDRARGSGGEEVRAPGQHVGVPHRGQPRGGRRHPEGHEHAAVDRVPDQPALAEVAAGHAHRTDLRRAAERPVVPRHRQDLVELTHRCASSRRRPPRAKAEPMVTP